MATAAARILATTREMLADADHESTVNLVRASLQDSVDTHGTHGGWLDTEAKTLSEAQDVARAAIAAATGTQA